MKDKTMKLDLQMFATASTQNQNTTGASGMSAEMKTFYEKRLIDQAEPALVHDQFGDPYPIPANGGKNIEFRKYDSLPKATTPLTEGVTPDGQTMNVSTVTAEVKQYGGWVPITDTLQLTSIDNNILQATKIIASQAGRTLDTIVRDVAGGRHQCDLCAQDRRRRRGDRCDQPRHPGRDLPADQRPDRPCGHPAEGHER